MKPYFTCKVLNDPCPNKTELFPTVKATLPLIICTYG